MVKEPLNLKVNPAEGILGISLNEMSPNISSSANSYETVFVATLMPVAVAGKRILSVGEGGSDALARLIDLGADAYAIDPKYQNLNGLTSEIEMSALESEISLGYDSGVVDGVLNNFIQALEDNPGRYLAASADRIPFPDNHFDLLYSMNSVMGYMDLDRSIITSVINECLRVIRPGGSIRLYPFKGIDNFSPGDTQLRINNGNFIFTKLLNDKRVAKIAPLKLQIADINKMLLIQKA